MLLKSVSSNAISGFSPNFRVFSNPIQKINFSSNIERDTLEFNPVKIDSASYSSELDEEQTAQIENAAKLIASPNYNIPPIGVGANGNVFKIDGVRGFYDGLTFKISHTENRNPITGEMQRVNENFDDEIEKLKAAYTTNPKNQNYVADFKLKDGRNILVSSYVVGKNPDIKDRPLTKESLKDLLETFEELDEEGILHRDLKKENILIDDENRAGLIDYGQAIYFDVKNYLQNSDENNFAPFIPPTNLRNFEDTCLFPYLNDLKKEDPKAAEALFRDYLTLKAPMYEKRAQALEDRIQEGDLDFEETQQLRKMQDYLLTMAEIYQNPDDDVIKAEMLNGEITYNSELAYKNEILLLNPMANSTLKFNSLVAAKRLEALSGEKLQRPNTLLKKSYYSYQKDYAQYRLDKVSGWLNGLTGWLLSCFKTPINEAQGGQKEIIEQIVNNPSIGSFEIPEVETL